MITVDRGSFLQILGLDFGFLLLGRWDHGSQRSPGNFTFLTDKLFFSFNDYNTTAELREQAFNVTQTWPGILKSLQILF